MSLSNIGNEKSPKIFFSISGRSVSKSHPRIHFCLRCWMGFSVVLYRVPSIFDCSKLAATASAASKNYFLIFEIQLQEENISLQGKNPFSITTGKKNPQIFFQGDEKNTKNGEEIRHRMKERDMQKGNAMLALKKINHTKLFFSFFF